MAIAANSQKPQQFSARLADDGPMRHHVKSIEAVWIALLGSGRHSALSVLRPFSPPSVRSVARQGTSLAFGCILIGLAVAMLVQADLGLAPYDVLSSGVADRLGMTLGQAGWGIAAVLFLTAAALGQRPSIWGLLYIFGNGLAIDGASELLNQPDSVVGRVLYVLGAVLAMAFGVNLVLHSGTTGGPFELLMRAGADRGLNPMMIRYTLDVGGLASGVLLGGSAGFGTVAYALLMGRVLQVVNQVFVDHSYGRSTRMTPPQPSFEPAPGESRDPVRV